MAYEAQKLDLEDLLKKYESKEIREKILDLVALSRLLAESVISDKYKVSNELSSTLTHASAEGAAVRMSLMSPTEKGRPKNADLTPADINLMNLLALFNSDLLLDIKKTDPVQVAKVIGDEIADRVLLFPFQFGREIYDEFNAAHPDEITHLEHEKSMELLEKSPTGVFHQRGFLFGPLGLIVTEHSRSVAPRRDIYLQHSADRSYDRPHRIWLSSSSSAPINHLRGKHSEALDRIQQAPSAWGEYLSAITISSKDDYVEDSERSIVYLLGDALDDIELGKLLERLVEEHGYVRESLEGCLRFTANTDEPDWHQALDRPTKMQAVMCARDEHLVTELNSLVLNSAITVPPGEVRSAVLNGRRFLGQWGTYMELGRLGTRVVSRYPRLPLLRLQSLAKKVFEQAGDTYKSNALWKFRQFDKLDGFERIRESLSENNPEESVLKLFVEEREALGIVAENLGFQLVDTRSDEYYSEIILWRLGFDVLGPRTQREEYLLAFQETMRSIPESTAQSGWAIALRETTVNYFVQLEKYLKEILSFATWALTSDHYGAARPFTYIADDAEHCCAQKLGIAKFENINLNPLIEKFSQLANVLEEYCEDAKKHERADVQLPEFAKKTDLQDFPFRHTFVFLDLEKTSREKLIKTLRSFAGQLQLVQISSIRNALLHPKGDVPDPETVREALKQVRDGLLALEDVGLTALPAEFAGSSTDRWGSTEFRFIRGEFSEVILVAPSRLEFARLPRLAKDQILMPGVVIDRANEPLRFDVGIPSRYADYWSGFPVIPRSSEVLSRRGELSGQGS